MDTIYSRLIAKVAEWHKLDRDEYEGYNVSFAIELEALAKRVCADAVKKLMDVDNEEVDFHEERDYEADAVLGGSHKILYSNVNDVCRSVIGGPQ